MAIQSASAKLYTGIRCWCVDKNISANLVSVFNVGRYIPGTSSGDGGAFVAEPSRWAVDVNRVIRGIADLVSVRSLTLADSRLKTFGGGNNVITIDGTDNTNNWKVRASVVCKFPTYMRVDVEKLQLPEGTTCTVSFEEDWVRDGVYLESTQASSAAIPNFFTFRTPYYGLSFMSSAFSLPSLTNFRARLIGMNVSSAFTPLMTANVTRAGTDDMQSAFGLVARVGFRKYFAVQMTSAFEGNEPGGLPFLIGNGYEYPPGSPFAYLNPPPPWQFPGALRIRQDTATIVEASTATLTAEAYNLPYIVSNVNLASASTMTAQLDAYKGVGTPNLQATASLSCSIRVDYNSVIPEMQSNATVFCRTPVQAQAAITVSSSVTAVQGAPLILTWNAIDPGLTTGIVFKGPNIDITIKWSTGFIDTVSGGTSNPDILDAPITTYYSRTHTATDNITAEIYGTLSGFQFSKNGIDTINGEINGDEITGTLYSGTWYVPGRQRLVSCSNWGDVGLTNLNGAFANCVNLTTVPTFLPNVPTGTNLPMACAFLNNFYLNSPNLINWNTSKVNTMAGMFRNAVQMRQPIGNWNTGNVTSMKRMFAMNIHSGGSLVGYASQYPNTNTLTWDVTNVSRANMASMFEQHTGANLQLSSWCVSHITTAPLNFTYQNTTSWPTARRPQWGTCP